MRITIDATSALLRSAGVKGYTYHWLRHLRQQAAAGEEIRAFPLLERLGRPGSRTFGAAARVHLGPAGPAAFRERFGPFGSGPGPARNPRLSCRQSGSQDARAGAPDRDHPRSHVLDHARSSTQATLRADQAFAEQILKRADGLIAVSENTRQDAIRLLGIEPERIRTIHSGVAEEYFDARPRARAKPYVLFVGTVEPRKNLDTLLDAWRSVKPEIRERFDLVIAGPEGWDSSGTMARIRQEATYLGYVPEAEMPGLVAGAALFVYPSLYEGFGFPVVQAMAANVPVLSSRTSCLPEIAGDAAVYVDPRSPSEMAAQLTRLLESPEERSRLARLGGRGPNVIAGSGARRNRSRSSGRLQAIDLLAPGPMPKSHTCQLSAPSVYSTSAYSPGSSGCSGQIL